MPDQPQHINWADRLEDYATGRMSSQDMHRMEEAAHSDPFLMDAMEGYRLLQESGQLPKAMATLREKTAVPTAQQQTPVRRIGTSWWQWAAAAALITLIGFGVANWVKRDSVGPAIVSADVSDTQRVSDLPDIVVGPADAPSPEAGQARKTGQPTLPGGKTKEQAGKLNTEDALVLQTDELPTAPSAPVAEKPLPSAAARSAAEAPMFQLSGKVVDETNDEPVDAAVITMNGQDVKADALGRFNIAARSLPMDLKVAAAGYRSKQVKWQQGTTSLNIKLQPAPPTVQEQVIQSNPVPKAAGTWVVIPNDTSSTAPIVGWAAYNEYFRTNKKARGTSKLYKSVTISFSVDGKGRPYEIEVTQSAGEEAKAEAVRLLQNGPAWRSRRGATPAATITVKY